VLYLYVYNIVNEEETAYLTNTLCGRRERKDLERLLGGTRSSLDAKISSVNETIRMQHASVHGGTEDLRLSQAGSHEATMQRVNGLGKYEEDYDKNVEDVVKRQSDDVYAVQRNVQQTGHSLEQERIDSKQKLLLALNSGEAFVCVRMCVFQCVRLRVRP
jgi:hypothetical protein